MARALARQPPTAMWQEGRAQSSDQEVVRHRSCPTLDERRAGVVAFLGQGVAEDAAVAEACKGFGLTANPNPRPWPDAHGFGKARCQEKEEQGQRMKWRPSFYLQRKVPAVLLTHANSPRAWTFGEAQQKHEIPRSALAA